MKNKTTNNLIRKKYEKTMKREIDKKVGSITIIVTEDTYDKALSAFNIAVGGVEMGMNVYMFFTARGINILNKAYKPNLCLLGSRCLAPHAKHGSRLPSKFFEASYCCSLFLCP